MSTVAANPSASASDLPDKTVRQLFWRLIPFLFVVYVVNYLDRVNVGFAALQMQAQLGLSDRVYGFGAGIFFAGYFIFQVPGNLVMTRVGARRWIAAIMIVWGVISSCMIFVRTAHEFYLLRFCLGIAESGFFPGIILYLKNWFPASARARAIALFMTAIPISGVVGSPISGALLEVRGWHLAGWQWLFLIEGLPAILLGIATLALLVEHPDSATWLSFEQRTWLKTELARERDAHPHAALHWSGAFLSPAVWLLTLVYGGICTCMYGIIYFLPKLIRAVSNVSDFRIGLLSSLPYLITAIAMVLVASHSDRRNERRWHLACGACTGAFAAWFAAHVNSTAPTVLFLSIALAGTLSMMGPFWALSSKSLSQSTAPAGIALINSFGNIGGFIGPYVMGRLSATAGLRGGIVVTGCALLLSGGISVLVREHRQTSSP
jgi:MFS transporter, ACS family, tartrate transporter